MRDVHAVRTFLPFIIVGVVTGSIYGLAAMGLVLTYKTSGIFNLAHGAIGTAAAYVFFELHQQQGVPWPLAAAITLLVAAPALGLVLEWLARGVTRAPTVLKIVATVGVMLVIQGIAVVKYGAPTRNFLPFLPTSTFRAFVVNVGWDQLIIVVIALGCAAGLYAFLRFTRLGVSMRGVVDDPDLLGLGGVNSVAVYRWSWLIGSVFASMSGILFAPIIGLNALFLTLLVLQAYGAAAVGWFSSLPLTYLGGLVVGIGAAIATKYASSPRLAGLPSSFPFLVLFVVLLAAPKGRLVEAGSRLVSRAVERPVMSRAVRYAGGGLFLVLLVLVPNLVGARLPVYSNALIYAIIFLSLGLLVRTSGQVSLCHMGFAAVGASTFAHFSAHGLGLPWPLALLGAGLAAVPVGALVAIPAIRLSGIYLALATFGFGILLERMIYGYGIMFGHRDQLNMPQYFGLGSDRAYYYAILGVAVLACALVVLVLRSRLGRLLRALADSPVALSVHGLNVNLTRVVVFCISAFLAAVAGAMIGPLYGNVNGVPFPAFQSLTLLVVLAIAGPGTLRSTFVAAAFFVVAPSYIRNATFIDLLPVLFGVSAIGIALIAGRAPRRRSVADEVAGATRITIDRSRSPVTERVPIASAGRRRS